MCSCFFTAVVFTKKSIPKFIKLSRGLFMIYIAYDNVQCWA